MSLCTPSRPRTESEGEVNPAAAVRTFKSLRGDLMTAIVDALPLANTLYSKFIIPESTMNRVVVSCLAKEEKNVALLDAIEARLQTNPSDFWTLVAILEADPILKIFANKLRESYCKLYQYSIMGVFKPDRHFGHTMSIECTGETRCV